MADWDPVAYLKFQAERTRPSIDLVARIDSADPGAVIDLGCGPGNSTLILAERWPDAEITGVDNSPEMINKARTDHSRVHWVLGDISRLEGRDRYDVVFSNAALQWVPDHQELIPRLLGLCRPDGILAVQVPANQESSLHRALLSVARSSEWKGYTGESDRALNYRSADYYYDILCGLTQRIDLWETTYMHVLPNHRALTDWYKSTGMRPFLDALPDEPSRREFEDEVLDICRKEYALQADGTVLYPFRRLFFTARKS